MTARGNEVAPAREDTEKEHARKKERRTQHGNQRGGRPREDAVLPLRGQAAKGWCNQLEDGRHDPFPPYLGPSGKPIREGPHLALTHDSKQARQA